jgi:hypothetical protein
LIQILVLNGWSILQELEIIGIGPTLENHGLFLISRMDRALASVVRIGHHSSD